MTRYLVEYKQTYAERYHTTRDVRARAALLEHGVPIIRTYGRYDAGAMEGTAGFEISVASTGELEKVVALVEDVIGQAVLLRQAPPRTEADAR